MCHGHRADWHEAEEEYERFLEAADEPPEGETPAFLEEEPAEDVELLTDGGDE